MTNELTGLGSLFGGGPASLLNPVLFDDPQQAYSGLAQQRDMQDRFIFEQMRAQQQGFVPPPPPDPRAYIGKVTAKPGFIVENERHDWTTGSGKTWTVRKKVLDDYPWRDRLVIRWEMFKEWMSH